MRTLYAKVISPDKQNTKVFEVVAETNVECVDLLSPKLNEFPEESTFVLIFKQVKGNHD